MTAEPPTTTVLPAPEAPTPPRPTAARGLARLWTPPRIMGLDLARGLAIIGMLAAHTVASPPFDWADPATWGDIVNGRSSILFGVIAGISIALMTRVRPTDREGLRRERLRLLGRGVLIFLIGVVLELMGTGIAVILGIYGVLFIAVIPFLSWRRRSLVITAGILAVVSAVTTPLVTQLLGANGFAGIGGDVLTNIYPPLEWLALVLVGLAIGRSSFTRPRVAAGLLALGIVLAGIGYGAAALAAPLVGSSTDDLQLDTVPGEDVDISDLMCQTYDDGSVYCYSTVPQDEAPDTASEAVPDLGAAVGPYFARAIFTDYAHSGGLAEIVGSVGVALIVLGGCLLVARPLRWVLAPLAAMGSMPLTAYSLQVVLIAIARPLLPPVTPEFDPGLALWAGLTVTILIATTIWASLARRGPLERLMDWSSRRWSVEGNLSRADRERIEPSAESADSNGSARAVHSNEDAGTNGRDAT